MRRSQYQHRRARPRQGAHQFVSCMAIEEERMPAMPPKALTSPYSFALAGALSTRNCAQSASELSATRVGQAVRGPLPNSRCLTLTLHCRSYNVNRTEGRGSEAVPPGVGGAWDAAQAAHTTSTRELGAWRRENSYGAYHGSLDCALRQLSDSRAATR